MLRLPRAVRSEPDTPARTRLMHRGLGAAAEDVAPDGFVPQTDTARDAGIVGGDMDVVRQDGSDAGGVSSTQIQDVIVHERVDVLDDLEHALVPLPAAERLARGVADILIVGLVLVDRVLRQLEVWRERPVAEDRAADAGAERQHNLEPLPLDDPQPLDL